MARQAEAEVEIFSTFGSGRYVGTQVRQGRATENYLHAGTYGPRFTLDGRYAPLKKDWGGNYRYRLLRYRVAGGEWVTINEPSPKPEAVNA